MKWTVVFCLEKPPVLLGRPTFQSRTPKDSFILTLLLPPVGLFWSLGWRKWISRLWGGEKKKKKERKKGFPPFLWIYTDFFKIVLLLWRTSKWGKNYTLFLLKSRERHKGWQRLRYNRKPKIKLQNSGLDAITTFPSTSNESRVLWKKISE